VGSIDRQHSTPQLLNRLRMRQVALLLAIEETGTLRAAAEQLGLTQPAATKMLSELETSLGQRLFDRVGRGLQRNAAGERVTGYFRSIRGSMEALNRDLEELRAGGAVKLAVGSIMAASPGRLTEALLQLKREFPLLAVEVAVDTSDRLLAQLREGVLELVIGRMVAVPGVDCKFTPIHDEALAVIWGNEHPLAGRRRVDFQALLDYPWILQPPGSPMRELIEREFRHHHAQLPRGLIETGSILTTMNLVQSSELLGVIPQAVAQAHAEHGMVRILPYPFRHALESYGTLVPRDRPLSAPAERFVQLLHRAGEKGRAS
jgi:DNA-binding transcriptional LysR family regulator